MTTPMSNIPPNSRVSPSDRNPSARQASVSTEQLLPPVEPPSGRFVLQLFIIPAVIVACVVGVWFLIESVARSGEQDAATILKGLRSANGFQQANDLAEMLRVPERYPELRKKHDLAQGVADYLNELIDAGDEADGAVTMRYFLVSLLGEMHVDDGVPVLIKAALRDRARDVRRKAINSLAVLAGSLARLDPPSAIGGDDLVAALLKLANDEDELIRSETAFAIGVIAAAPDADARLIDALRILANDPYTDARFNAAVALARIGNPLAGKALAEMLDLEAIAASLSGEKPISENQTEVALRSQREYKRNTILTSALSAIDLLAKAKPGSDSLAVVAAALEKFLAVAPTIQDPAPLPKELLDAARSTLARIQGVEKS